jgi:hypothetical protein
LLGCCNDRAKQLHASPSGFTIYNFLFALIYILSELLQTTFQEFNCICKCTLIIIIIIIIVIILIIMTIGISITITIIDF